LARRDLATGLLLALLLLTGCRSSKPAPDAGAPSPIPTCTDCNLILISIDTLRADHLDCYGYPRETSPNLGTLVARASRFEEAWSHSPHTAPSHMSMLTGLTPDVHGVFPYHPEAVSNPFRLDPRVPTLAERLTRQGFETAGFHGGGHVSPGYGFGRGFARYVEDDLWREGLAWLDQRGDERFFAFFHTYQVHDPYQPPEPYFSMFAEPEDTDIGRVRGRDREARRSAFWAQVNAEDPRALARLVSLYDGGIRHVDEQLLRPLFEILEERGLWERSLVIFTSDHGEEFMEHGGVTHDALYSEVLRVPLLVAMPLRLSAQRPPRARVEGAARLIDLVPTALELLGLPAASDEIQGRSLVPALYGTDAEDRSVHACQVDRVPGVVHQTRAYARVQGNRKLIWNLLGPRRGYELYDLDTDPRELVDLAAARSREHERLRGRLEAEIAAGAALRQRRQIRPTPMQIDDGELERLRSLGYLE